MNYRSQEFQKLPEEAMEIRREVFMLEQGFVDEFDEIDQTGNHIVLYEAERPVGTCRYFFHQERGCYVIGRLAVRKDARGKHYGKALVERAEAGIREKKGTKVELSAQLRVSGFYQSCGYEQLPELHDEQGCPHVWMRKYISVRDDPFLLGRGTC